VSSRAESFAREFTPALTLSAPGAEASSNRQHVAPAVPAASIAAASPFQESPSLKLRSAMVMPPCTTKTMRGNAGSASVASFGKTSS
jgi:hypothetical protein